MRANATMACWIVVLSLGLVMAGAEAHADTTIEVATGVSETTPQGGSGPGGPCEGIAGLSCDEGLICILPPGLCDWFDLLGTCVELPCPSTYEPVCGCDGVTYDNACFAHLLGTVPPTATHVGVDYEGICVTDTPAVSGAGAVALIFLVLVVGTTLLVYRRSSKRA